MVARKLNRIITEHPNIVASKAHSNRSLLIVLDRNMDLISPIQHTSTYQALIDDLLDHHANRVEFTISHDQDRGNKTTTSKKKFDLDPDTDTFYSKYKFSPFPEAIESNGLELQEVTSREKAIRSKTVSSAGASSDLDTMVGSAASDLASAVEKKDI